MLQRFILAWRLLAVALPLAWLVENPCLGGDETSASGVQNTEQDDRKGKEDVNLVFKTGGGTQLWTDHLHRDGYRIQQHALTGHWRLLDSKNVRRAWGSRAHCETTLEKLHPQTTETDSAKRVVILLHGLMRSRASMKSMESALVDPSRYQIVRFSYASTRSSIADHAQALRDVMEGMPGETEFSFVGHSMGGIVVRHLVGDLHRDDPGNLLKRCRSLVMLGPPNQGASIARRLARTGVFGLVSGKGALELGPRWSELQQRLATPPFPFAIVAGDLSHNPIRNPLVDGDGDLIVSVDEARLEGSEWFEIVPVVHSLLMNDKTVQKRTAEFIDQHWSRSPGVEQP